MVYIVHYETAAGDRPGEWLRVFGDDQEAVEWMADEVADEATLMALEEPLHEGWIGIARVASYYPKAIWSPDAAQMATAKLGKGATQRLQVAR